MYTKEQMLENYNQFNVKAIRSFVEDASKKAYQDHRKSFLINLRLLEQKCTMTFIQIVKCLDEIAKENGYDGKRTDNYYRFG